MRILRAADRVSSPWKNGGGRTAEIAVHPKGAGLEDFSWRVSTAIVARDGAFSIFPGVDRSLTVLEGDLRLRPQGAPPITLDPTSAAATFAGDAPCRGELLMGPVLDLNVMVRRDKFAARVQRATEALLVEVARDADWTILFALDVFHLSSARQMVRLGRYDAVMFQKGERFDLDTRDGAALHRVEITAVKPS
jgi:environmental stress-induced protein Ves